MVFLLLKVLHSLLIPLLLLILLTEVQLKTDPVYNLVTFPSTIEIKLKEEDSIISFQNISNQEYFFYTNNDTLFFQSTSGLKQYKFESSSSPKGFSSIIKTNDNYFFLCPLVGTTLYSFTTSNLKLKEINPLQFTSDFSGNKDTNITCDIDKAEHKILNIFYKGNQNAYQYYYNSGTLTYDRKKIVNGLPPIYFHQQFKETNGEIGYYYIIVTYDLNGYKIHIRKVNSHGIDTTTSEGTGDYFYNKTIYFSQDNIDVSYYLQKHVGILSYDNEGKRFSMLLFTFPALTRGNWNLYSYKQYNYLNVDIGKDYYVKKAKFFSPFSNYYYYYITVKDKEKESYFGVIDMMLNIVIYNAKSDEKFTSIMSLSPNSLLILSNKGHIICPFSSQSGKCEKCINDKQINPQDTQYCKRKDKNDPNCQPLKETTNSQYLLMNNNGQNTCLSSKEYTNQLLLDDSYCYKDSCPNFYYKQEGDTKQCSFCNALFIYNEEDNSNSCISICPSGYAQYNNQCKTCSEMKMLIYRGDKITIDSITYKDGNCISQENCPPYSEISNGECIYCKNNNKWFFNNTCIEECDSTQKHNNDTHECIDCSKTNTPYLFENECIEKCNEFSVKDDYSKICKSCEKNETHPYFYDNKCIKECYENTYVKNNPVKHCVFCGINDQYLYNNQCWDNCTNMEKDEENWICVDCKANNNYFYKDKCVSQCNINSIVDEENKLCSDCDEGLYFYNNTCIPKCYNYTITDEENKMCLDCDEETPFIYNNTCKANCDEYYGYDENKICYLCSEKGLWYQDEQCVESCGISYKHNNENKSCEKCPIEEPYVTADDRCIAECKAPLIKDNEKMTCTSCGDQQYYFDESCVDNCPNTTEEDASKRICIHCKNMNTYAFNSKCITQCPYDAIVDETEKTCYQCKEGELIINETCIEQEECDEGYEYNSTTNRCIQCSSNNLFYYNKTCIEICPNNTQSENYTCTFCGANEEFLDMDKNKCVKQSQCTPNAVIDYEKYTCKKCSDKLYLSDNKCVEDCPKGYKKNDDMTCSSCKDYPSTPFYENDKCVEQCQEGSSIDEFNRCIKCKDQEKNKFLYNNTCVDKCPTNSIINSTTNECTLCEGSTPFLLRKNNTCIDKTTCIANLGAYNDDTLVCDICRYTTNPYFYNNTCLNKCLDYHVIKDELQCIQCKEINSSFPFYFNGQCINECSSIGGYYDDNYECKLCSTYSKYLYFGKNKCISYDDCKTQNLIIKENNTCDECSLGMKSYNNTCVHQCPKYTVENCNGNLCGCKICSEENKYYYEGQCITHEECESHQNILIDEIKKICYSTICNFDCFNGFICDNKTNKCLCGENYSGSLCQYYSDPSEVIHQEEFDIEIYSIHNEKIEIDKETVFAFKTKKELSNYIITWKIVDVNVREIREDAYINGKNEDVLKIAKYSFEKGQYTIRCEIEDSNIENILIGELIINVDVFDPDKFGIAFIYSKEETFYAMESELTLSITKENSELRNLEETTNENNILMYKYYYVDIFGDMLPLTTNYTLYEDITVKLPYTKKLILEIKDTKGQINRKEIELPFNVVIDEYMNLSITKDIISNNNLSNNQKLLYTYNYIVTLKDTNAIKEEDFKLISSFLNTMINKSITTSNSNNDITPTSVLSILNKLMLSQQGEDISTMNTIGNIVFDSINNITEDTISNENNIRAFYRNIDNILSQVNTEKTLRRLEESDDNEKDMIEEMLTKGRDSILQLNKYVSNTLVQGEGKIINGKHFNSYLTMPSRNQTTIDIHSSLSNKRIRRLTEDNEEDINEYNPNSFPSKSLSKKSSCEEGKSESLFCVDKRYIQSLQNKLSLSTVDGSKDLSIGIIEMNNTLLIQSMGLTPIAQSSVISQINTNAQFINEEEKLRFLSNEEEDDSLIEQLKYVISLDFLDNEQFISSLAANSTCVSLSQLKKPKQSMSCMTYFDYENNKTICKCTGSGEIVPVYNYTLANLYKLTQFPEITIDLINSFNVSFILSSMALMSFYSIVLLMLDYRDDRKYKRPNAIDEFMQINSLNERTLITLSWYATSYTYPFLSVLFLYNYNQPRFFRFLIQMFSSLVSIVFSSIPFYYSDFTYKNLFIDKRDIVTEYYDIHNLPAQLNDIIASFIYSIIASIIANLIVLLFQYILKYKQLLLIIWKDKKNLMLDYVRSHFIKDTVMMSFEKARRRFYLKFRALNMIGSKFFIKEQIKYNKDVYLKRQKDDMAKQIIMKKEKELSEYKSRTVSPLIKKQPKKKIPLLRLNSDHSHKNSRMEVDEKSKYENLSIDTLTRFSVNKIQSCLSFDEEKEMNKIRKSYYESLESERSDSSLYKLKKQTTKLRSSLPLLLKSREEYSIVKLPQYTFFNEKQNTNLKDKDKREICQLILTIISVLLLVGFFSIVYFYIFIIFADIYQRYELYIVKSWLVPSLINIIIVRFFTTYIKNLCFMIVIKLFYKRRKNYCIINLLFRFVVPKYLIYIYKTRNIITKYYSDFRNEVKRIKGDEFVIYV